MAADDDGWIGSGLHGPALDAVGTQLDYFGPWLRILEQATAEGDLGTHGYLPRSDRVNRTRNQ